MRPTTNPEQDSYVGSRSSYAGGFVQWCQNARRLQGLLPSSWRTDQVVLSTVKDVHVRLAQFAGCNALKRRQVLDEVSIAADACQRKVGKKNGFFIKVNLYKWQLFAMTDYDVVLFADLDLELVPLAETEPTLAAAFWRRFIERFAKASGPKLAANPDTWSPLNGGLMLLRPWQPLYADGMEVLRSCRYNATHGWELTGVRPAIAAPTLPVSSWLRAHLPWDFGSAATEQGLFFYMLWIRHPGVGEYGPLENDGNAPLCRHWMAGHKPWLKLAGLTRTTASKREGREPLNLALMYDYAVRETAAYDRREAGQSSPPVLVSVQREARRLIEHHPSFADAFYIWQRYGRDKSGFPLHFPVPDGSPGPGPGGAKVP